MCFHNRQKWNGHSWACCYSNTIFKSNGRNRLFHFFRPSHSKDCVAIAMHLIVALFFPFLIEVCWLLYCVVYSLCNISQLAKQDNRKCIFATDRILEQNSVRRTFKRVATIMCDHDCTSLVFLRSGMVVYPCDIHKVSKLLIGKEGQLKKEVPSVAMMTNFGFGPNT